MKKEIIYSLVVAFIMTYLFRPIIFIITNLFEDAAAPFVMNNAKFFVSFILIFEILIPVIILIVLYRLLVKIFLGEIKLQRIHPNLLFVIITLLLIGHSLVPLLIDFSPFGYGSMATYGENLLYSATPFYR